MKRMFVVCLVSLLLSFLLVCSPVEIRADDISLLVPEWSQVIHSPFELIDPPEISNPVLTAGDVTEVNAKFVADPFIYREDDTWYMFFEVFNNDSGRGEIGLATSADGMHWEYDQIVLAEYFHLSYPLVFKYDSTYYMIPETKAINEVRIYQALSFPYRWVYATTLISGKPFVDSSLFHYEGKWWMFLGQKDDCFLYYSENLFSEWREHPKSPIVLNDASKARPAGRAFVYDNDRLIRLAQKNDLNYGQQVRVFEVDVLTDFSYAEHEITESPVLLNSGSGWNASGMHQLDPWWNGDYWLSAVDGNDDGIWAIGIYRTLDSQNELRIDSLNVSSGEPYEVGYYGLKDGALAYIDRSYYFTAIPADLQGATYIRTANNDKSSTGDNFLSFEVNRDVTVYVAHDDLISVKPSWLQAFTDSGDQLVNTDKSLSLFMREYPAGPITLGGNEGAGHSMYVVVLVPQAGPPPPAEKTIDPYPADGSVDAPRTIELSWSNGGGAVSYDVYVGQSPQLAIGDYKGTQTATVYDPGLLEASTTYYWRIDARNSVGVATGDVWEFTTGTEVVTEELELRNLTVDSGEAYQVVYDGLGNGALAYIDRSYYFTTIPADLQGATYIRTANNDKSSTGDNFLSFEVNRDVTVYVAHDDLISVKPSWLQAFTDSGDQLVNTDKSLSLFMREYPAGPITLGGNEGAGHSMYVVVLVTQVP